MAAKNRNQKIPAKQVSFKQIRRKQSVKKAGSLFFRIAWRSAVCLVFIFFALVLYQNRHDLTYDGFVQWARDSVAVMGVGDGFPVTVTGSRAYDLKAFNGAVFSLTDTTLVAYNNTGKKAADRQHSYNHPVLELGDRRALLYDMGSKSYRIESISGTIIDGKTENRIIVADIGETGEYAIAERTKGSLAEVTLYKKDGTGILKWVSNEYQIVDVAVSPNGKGFAVAGIAADSGDLRSAVMVFQQGSDEAIVSHEIKSNMYLSLAYTASDYVTVIGDSGVTVLNIAENKAMDYGYSGRSLACYDVKMNNGTVLMLSKYRDRKLCSMFVIDKTGIKISETEVNLESVGVCLNGKYIYIVASGFLYEYRNDGTFEKKEEVGADITKIAVLGSRAYVGGMSSIRKIDI